MTDILTIIALQLALMKNAEHVQFHSNVRNIITTATPDKLGLSNDVFNPYRDAILAEQDIVNRALASIYTPQLEEANTKRVAIFRMIRYKLNAVNSLTADAYPNVVKLQSKVQNALLNVYKASICNLAYQELSSTLAGFVLDCRELLTDEEVETLTIDADLDDLESANIKFGRLYQQRITERAADPVYTSDLRAATDLAYKRLVLHLNALANDPTAANKAKADAASEVVSSINQVIKEAKRLLNQRLGKGEAPSDDNGNDNENPNGSPNPNGNQNSNNNPNGNPNTGNNPSTPTPGGNDVVIDNPGDNYE